MKRPLQLTLVGLFSALLLFPQYLRAEIETRVNPRALNKCYGLSFMWNGCWGRVSLKGQITEGEFRKGELVGIVHQTDTGNGTKYVGRLTDGERNGEGALYLSNGASYSGQFRMGQKHGRGIFVSSDGHKYVGEWRDDKEHGRGTLFAPNGKALYEGTWVAGLKRPTAAGNKANDQGTLLAIAPPPKVQREKLSTNPKVEAQQKAASSEAVELNRTAEELARQKAELERERLIQEREKVEAAELLKKQRAEIERLRAQKAELEKLAANQTNASTTSADQPNEKHTSADKQIPQVNANPRKALIIGNNKYKTVTALNNAVADAKAMASKLRSIGYSVTSSYDSSRAEMLSSLRNFVYSVQGGDEVVFFYAGHGVELDGKNFLLPTDIKGDDPRQVEDDAIELQRVLNDMSENRAKFTLAIVDACRDNPFKGNGRAIGGRGLAPTTAATGQMVIFSAGAGQQALDKLSDGDQNPNGLFTRIFLEEMSRTGVSIDRVVKKVRRRVVELASSVGHQQVPAIYDQVIGDFFFVKAP